MATTPLLLSGKHFFSEQNVPIDTKATEMVIHKYCMVRQSSWSSQQWMQPLNSFTPNSLSKPPNQNSEQALVKYHSCETRTLAQNKVPQATPSRNADLTRFREQACN